MELINHKVKYNDFNLFCYGDVHEGAKHKHKEGWAKLVEMLHSKYDGLHERRNFALDHGDIMEGICTDHPYYDALTVEGNILRQIEECVKQRIAIKDKIVCILDGNHPYNLIKFGEVTKVVCERLGVKYGTFTSRIAYTNKDIVMFKHFATHGHGTINSTIDDPTDRHNSMIRSLRKRLQWKASDCALMSMGHTHKLLVYEPKADLGIRDNGTELLSDYVRYANADNLPYNERWYLNTGSFLKLYELGISGYAERRNYDPLDLGFLIVKIRGGKIAGVDKIIL